MIPPREYHENPKQKPYIINIEDNQVFSADYVFQMMFYLRKQIDRMWRKVLLIACNRGRAYSNIPSMLIKSATMEIDVGIIHFQKLKVVSSYSIAHVF